MTVGLRPEDFHLAPERGQAVDAHAVATEVLGPEVILVAALGHPGTPEIMIRCPRGFTAAPGAMISSIMTGARSTSSTRPPPGGPCRGRHAAIEEHGWMLKDSFGADKPIIAMVHFGALPGIAARTTRPAACKRRSTMRRATSRRCRQGGVDAIMFGNENDRPYLLKASPEVAGRDGCGVGQLKPMLKVPFGVNYLWDPVASVGASPRPPAPASRARSSPASSLPTWACGSRTAPARCGCGADLGRPDLKLLFNINAEFASLARHAADRAAGEERGVLVAGRRRSWSPGR